jgi:hypothetical protein
MYIEPDLRMRIGGRYSRVEYRVGVADSEVEEA